MKQPRPPRRADRFLEWYCRPELLEEIQGDAYELFSIRVEEMGNSAAGRHFIWDVLRSLRISTIRHFSSNSFPTMLKSNFKIAFRQLKRQRLFSVIKIGGFALGIAACLLIALFIKDELNYDKHHPDVDLLYRCSIDFFDEGIVHKGSHFPAPMATIIKEEIPEVEMAGRINATALFTGPGSNQVKPSNTNVSTYEEGFIYADQELLDMFQFPFAHGDPARALEQNKTIVITKRKADKYFPNENPIGKTLTLNNDEEQTYKITGVFEDFPTTSHIQYDFFLSGAGVELWPGEQTFWGANNYFVYMKFRPGTDPLIVENKMATIVEKYLAPEWIKSGNMDIEDVMKIVTYRAQPVADIYLKGYEAHDGLTYGDIRFVWLFGAIAIFILLIACINFINLSTAKSANRALEVGLRKVMGSVKRNLVNQFLAESILFSFISFIIGAALASMFLPYFNELADKSIAIPWTAWWFLPLLIIAAIFIGILAGLYPSFYLSAFKPNQVLAGQLNRGRKSAYMRNGLVVFQFATSVILIVGTMIVYRQMNFILNKKIGFEKEQVLLIQGAQTLETEKINTFKDQLLNLSQIKNASVSDYLPIAGTKRNGNTFFEDGKIKTARGVGGQIWRVDHDYIETMGMEIVEGRDFQKDMPSDSLAIIINKTMASKLNFEDPVGKKITNGFQGPFNVIGVMEDFHFSTFREEIRPLCLVIGNSPNTISVKVNTENMGQLISSVTDIWTKFSPDQPIRYSFLDERFADMYADVQRMGRIITSFAFLAIIIACLGLFGLSAFTAEQRSKEMSIRKVLGASVQSIFQLLTKQFVALVVIAFFIAIPLAWYMMNKWLQDFAYQINMTWDVFMIAGLTILLIALITVSYQAIQTATNNPIKALRNE